MMRGECGRDGPIQTSQSGQTELDPRSAHSGLMDDLQAVQTKAIDALAAEDLTHNKLPSQNDLM